MTNQWKISKERIKEIRTLLGLTQEDFALILGVTKTTVGRYEIGQATPVGDAAKKLAQLDNSLVDPKQRELVRSTLEEEGGKAAMAGILASGSALLPLNTIIGCGLGIGAALAGFTGAALLNVLKKFHEQD